MKIMPRRNVGILTPYINWNITSPDQKLINLIKWREDFGYDPKISVEYTNCIKKYKKLFLSKWDKVFENINIPPKFEQAFTNLQATKLDGIRKSTFSKFENIQLTTQQKNKILKKAEINKDTIINYYSAYGYIRHPSIRVPENPFDWIKVLFGEGEGYIYMIYKWDRVNYELGRYSNVYDFKL